MKNLPKEPRLNKTIRLITALLFLAQSVYFISNALKAAEPLITSSIAGIFFILAIGNLRRLHWSRIPSEFLLAFVALGTSNNFMPMPDEQLVYPLREITNQFPIGAIWLFHVSIWASFLYMAYIISNSDQYFHKKWWR